MEGKVGYGGTENIGYVKYLWIFWVGENFI